MEPFDEAIRAMAGADAVHRRELPLDVRLLGRVELTVDGREIRLAARGAQALIALLALKPRVRTREAVAADIWPDSDGGGTSASLRQALWLVRSSFLSAGIVLTDYLDIDQDVIGLRPFATLELDVTRFEVALRDRPSRPEEAVALYRGDLVECLPLECFALDRERLSDAYEDALALVAERRLATGDLDGARTAAEGLLARDPLREEAHAILLHVHGQVGSRAQVIRQYRRLAELLDHDLGVEPLPETAAAYRSALAKSVERSRRRVVEAAFAGRGTTPAVAVGVAAATAGPGPTVAPGSTVSPASTVRAGSAVSPAAAASPGAAVSPAAAVAGAPVKIPVAAHG